METLLNKLKQKLDTLRIMKEDGVGTVRKKQLLRIGLIGGGSCILLSMVLNIFKGSEKPVQVNHDMNKAVTTIHADRIVTPLSSVKESDLWVARLESVVEGLKDKLDNLGQATAMQNKQVEVITQSLEKHGISTLGNRDAKADRAAVTPVPAPAFKSAPQVFPANGQRQENAVNRTQQPENAGSQDRPASRRKKHRLLHLTGAGNIQLSHKNPETYLPSGTYFKVITSSGTVVSTGTNSSADPHPLLLRLVDNGSLPKGLKGIVKDAIIIASCYGNASSERAVCRLKSLSWRDANNDPVEKPLKGWIASEDGMDGIRAAIVDRSSEIAREAFGAGLLGAASDFLKFQATSSVYPTSPFGGQNKALPGKDALMGAAASGVSNAFDKLAQYTIAKAESMSAVAVVSAGRVLDAILLEGVELTPDVGEPLKKLRAGPTPKPDSNNQTTFDREHLQPEGDM